MKKKMMILTIFSIVASSLFAALPTDIKFEGTASTIPLVSKLYYNNSLITENLEIGNINLTQDGRTENFEIKITGNENDNKNLLIDIVTENFKGSVNGVANVDSGIAVNVSDYQVNNVVTYGHHQDDVISTFYFFWEGDAELTAGSYVSNVTISYTFDE